MVLELVNNRLKGMLKWSDRLGSDEINELQTLIEMMNNYSKKKR